MRTSRQRAVVLGLLEGSAQFLGARRIHGLLTGRGHGVSLATVYRTLHALAADGELDVRQTGQGEHLYRRCARRDPHHHLLCRACQTAVELPGIPLEQWVAGQARDHGFTRISAVVELDGVCATCDQAEVRGRTRPEGGRP